MHKLEFFFDCSSPWTFLAFESLQQMLKNSQEALKNDPILIEHKQANGDG